MSLRRQKDVEEHKRLMLMGEVAVRFFINTGFEERALTYFKEHYLPKITEFKIESDKYVGIHEKETTEKMLNKRLQEIKEGINSGDYNATHKSINWAILTLESFGIPDTSRPKTIYARIIC